MAQKIVPCYRGQQLRNHVPCQAAASLGSRALLFAIQIKFYSSSMGLTDTPVPLPSGATATTAASGGNREELLGPRPAGMRAAAKQTLGAATRAVSPKVTEREAICPKNLSKFWKINLKAFSHKSGKLCYNHNYGRGWGCAALTENNEEGGEPYGTVPLQALWCDQKRR